MTPAQQERLAARRAKREAEKAIAQAYKVWCVKLSREIEEANRELPRYEMEELLEYLSDTIDRLEPRLKITLVVESRR